MNKVLEQFKALSDRNRLRVATLLHIDELCACQIVELLEVTGAMVSCHMGLLVRAGLVESRKEGRWVVKFLLGTGRCLCSMRHTFSVGCPRHDCWCVGGGVRYVGIGCFCQSHHELVQRKLTSEYTEKNRSASVY